MRLIAACLVMLISLASGCTRKEGEVERRHYEPPPPDTRRRLPSYREPAPSRIRKPAPPRRMKPERPDVVSEPESTALGEDVFYEAAAAAEAYFACRDPKEKKGLRRKALRLLEEAAAALETAAVFGEPVDETKRNEVRTLLGRIR